MVLFAPYFSEYLLGVGISFVLSNLVYYARKLYIEDVNIQKKVAERSARYLPSEFLSVISGLIVGNIVMFMTGGNSLLAGLVITRVDNLMYYGVILYREVRGSIDSTGSYTRKKCKQDLRNLLLEFGPAEIIQSFIIYPLFLTYIPKIFNSYSFGVVVAMIFANILFYVCVIPVYEWRKKKWKGE